MIVLILILFLYNQYVPVIANTYHVVVNLLQVKDHEDEKLVIAETTVANHL